MSWQIQISFDPDKVDTGTIVGIWTDPTYGTFSFSQRAIASVEGRNEFVAQAITARDAWQVLKANEAAKAANVLTAIIAADPQV
jgi:hypothetical protein